MAHSHGVILCLWTNSKTVCLYLLCLLAHFAAGQNTKKYQLKRKLAASSSSEVVDRVESGDVSGFRVDVVAALSCKYCLFEYTHTASHYSSHPLVPRDSSPPGSHKD